MSLDKISDLSKRHGAKFVDLKFVDFLGAWRHTTIPVHRLNQSLLTEGIAFDGSSLRMWQPIHASDMVMIPDPETAKMDPFFVQSTLSMICSIYDPLAKAPYPRDPRYIARKAEAYLQQTGLADTFFIGPEAEFFIFDDIRFDHSQSHAAFYAIDSIEGGWNSGRDECPNLGYKPRHKGAYCPIPPTDTLGDFRQEVMLVLQEGGIEVEVGHHEVASAGQCEIGIKFHRLLPSADQLMWFKYVVKNVARQHGKTATFMPKPIFGDNGSGMHCHQSLWKGGSSLFAGDKYAGLSELALYYVGGLIKHAKALAALTNPTINSYRRLVPGFEAPINLAYSSRNRSAAIRIPITVPSPDARRIEARFPDSSCNPYLAFSAMLMAGLDGIQNRLEPGAALEKDIFSLDKETSKRIPKMPICLEEALESLAQDHTFLLKGDVFTKDVIEGWIEYKRTHELHSAYQRPTPYEFFLYYDV
ncbi:type I glutamate--ammonia ligase [Pajaroellobacter abortibovis]|uniref:Glutamine synthetase n=1 Tax=Pajaroellobacter abortibovis TaxID=1882918 RepID=A0A1L6MVG6_9BACT|nr:type I glutamate--ammonia ligase [Pajaroellobacter abortibovis]APR99417.1 type I glutamate--ammonia ligase [Pajaroellobacter abortibovis]